MKSAWRLTQPRLFPADTAEMRVVGGLRMHGDPSRLKDDPVIPNRRTAIVAPAWPKNAADRELAAIATVAVRAQAQNALGSDPWLGLGDLTRQPSCVEFVKGLTTRNHRVSLNNFNTFRSLREYLANCGPLLAAQLAQIAEGGAWLDAGGGHATAMAEYRRIAGQKPRLVAVTAADNALMHGSKHTMPASQGVQVLEKRRLESIDKNEIGVFDIITDVMGAFSYSEQPDVILRRCLELLRRGGRLYVSTGVQKLHLTHADGRPLTVQDWLNSVTGAQLIETGCGGEWERNQYFVLEKVAHAVGVRRLTLLAFDNYAPPFRRYRLTV